MPDTEGGSGVRRARQRAVKFLEGISRNLQSDREQVNVERQLTSLLTGQSQSAERLTQMCRELEDDKRGLEEEVKKKQVELERTSKRLAGLKTVRPAFMDEYEELQDYLDRLYEAYVERFRNLDYLEQELDMLNREEQERVDANEKKLKALQKKLREEEWKLLRGDTEANDLPAAASFAADYPRPMSRDRNFRDGGRRRSRVQQQDYQVPEGFRQMEHDEFGPAPGVDAANDFDEPEFIDSGSDGIVSVGSKPEEGLVGSSSTLDLGTAAAVEPPNGVDDDDDEIIVESDEETMISQGTHSYRCEVTSDEEVEIIEDSDAEEAPGRQHHHELLIPRAIVAPMQAEKLFAIFEAFFNHASTPGAALVDKVHATYTFEIFPEKVGSGESKKWTIDLNTQPGKCTPQEGGGDCTFQLSAKDFLQLAANKLNPQMAFMTGKLKIKGDLGKAMKFTPDLLPKVDMKAALDASKSPKEIVALVLGGQKQSRLRPLPSIPPSLAAKPEWASYWQRLLRIIENPTFDKEPPEMVCDVCGTALATVYCPADRAHFCEACDASHHSVSALLLRHSRVPLCQSPFQFGECAEHPPELIESVCLDCAKLMCQHCVLLTDHPPHHQLISTIDVFRASPPPLPSDDQQRHLVRTIELLHKRMLSVRSNFVAVRDALDKHLADLLTRSSGINHQRTEVLDSIRREVLTDLIHFEWSAAFYLHQRLCLPMGEYLVARANYERGREFLVPVLREQAINEKELATKRLESRLPSTVTAPLTVSGTMDVFPAAVGDRLGPRTELMPGGFDAAEPPAVVGDGGLVVAHPARQHDVVYASKKSDKLRTSSQASSRRSEATLDVIDSSSGNEPPPRPLTPARPRSSTLRELMLASSGFVDEVNKRSITSSNSSSQSYPMSSR
ncbi:Clusterin-associated protein 1 [Perkinsus olseni]|uniref:Clusterin-associated protein 1 n=1 Tax=Perkinsus olseni TaxID=32597 RepID=A0A7J6M482_PEROL|nr:Clusterin-associated protein 1 [Perkinsus olseni]